MELFLPPGDELDDVARARRPVAPSPVLENPAAAPKMARLRKRPGAACPRMASHGIRAQTATEPRTRERTADARLPGRGARAAEAHDPLPVQPPGDLPAGAPLQCLRRLRSAALRR